MNTPELVQPPTDEAPVQGDPITTAADVRAIRHRKEERRKKWNGVAVKVASFRCPWPVTRVQYERIRNDAVNRWINDMEKRGWELRSKVAVDADKRTAAYGYSGDWLSVPLLDQVEIPCAAVFLKRKVETVRFEIAVAQK